MFGFLGGAELAGRSVSGGMGNYGIQDQRAALDILIIKDSSARCSTQIRWAPTNRQLADVLTKDQAAPADLIRSCMRSAEYQLSPEAGVLEKAAAERALRLSRGAMRQQQSTTWDKADSPKGDQSPLGPVP